jgi:hypothetical protein
MIDLLIGLAFVAMVLSPAIVASRHRDEPSEKDS